ncbi:MAG TPA: class II aldolase/adducin family protein [Acidimicrobiales bacterium]|nr:class II aldolase/adducin family protein [Acidimicrobiales bacterium]
MSPFVPSAEQLMPKLTPRQEIVLLARTLWREGYNDHLAGHITYNLGDGTLLCNPWFLLWNEFRSDDIIRIDLDGNVLEGDWPVPPGIPLHLELHKARHDVQVAVHNHSQWGTVWADMGAVPPCHDQSSALGGGTLVLVDEYEGAVNDPNLARRAVEKMDGADMAILAGHGVFITAKSIRAAHQRAVALEWRCRMAHAVRAAGVSGGELPATIRERFGQNDGAGFIGFWEAMVRQELREDPSLLD